MIRYPLAVCFVGDLLFELWEVVLAVGVLDVGEQFGPFAHEVVSAAEEVAGGAHFSGVDIGYGQGTSAEEGGDFMGVDFVVFAFAAVDRLHVEGMAQDEGDGFLSADICQPIPYEHAFGGDDDIVSVGGDGLEKGLGGGFSVVMEDGFAGLV